MKNSGFILADHMISLLIFALLAAYSFGLLLLAFSASTRLNQFEKKIKPRLLLEIIGNEVENSCLLKKSTRGWEYYRIVGVGIGEGKNCRLIHGKRGKYTMVEGKLVPHCSSGKFFFSLRHKELFLRGNTLYLKTGKSSQPLAEGIHEFLIQENEGLFRITIEGITTLRKRK